MNKKNEKNTIYIVYKKQNKQNACEKNDIKNKNIIRIKNNEKQPKYMVHVLHRSILCSIVSCSAL